MPPSKITFFHFMTMILFSMSEEIHMGAPLKIACSNKVDIAPNAPVEIVDGESKAELREKLSILEAKLQTTVSQYEERLNHFYKQVERRN